MSVIVEGRVVTMHFSVRLQNGDLIDTTEGKEPATFTVGDGNLPEGFERPLMGLKSGDIRSIIILPEQGFGKWREANQRIINRHKFSADIELKEGLVISFEDANGEGVPGVVKAIDGNSITVDFNHPLANKELIFEVNILEIKDLASPVKFQS